MVGVMSAPDRPGLVSAIFQTLGRENVNAPFIVQSIDLNNESHVQFCVACADCERVMQLLQPVGEAVRARKVVEVHPVAILSVFGPDFRERPGIAGRAFGACAGAGVNILAVSTSISTISWVISESDVPVARQALHEVFALP
jgi:aspartokinase